MNAPDHRVNPSSTDTYEESKDKNNFKNCGVRSKSIWSLSISALFGVFLYFCVLLYVKYEAEEIRVVCEIKPLEPSFPMVTLCNMNPYKSSASARFPDLAQLIEWYDYLVATGVRQRKQDAAVEKDEQELRQKRATSSSCNCNFDNPLTVASKDGQRTYVLYPKMSTNWSCAFACCAQSDLDGRLARPTKDDVPLLQVGGMLAKWILIGMYCSDSKTSCLWYDGPNNPSIGSKNVSIESVCDNCTSVTAGTPAGAVALTYYSKRTTSAYIVATVHDQDANTPLCQVSRAASSSSVSTTSVSEKQTPTTHGLTTAAAADHTSSLISTADQIGGSTSHMIFEKETATTTHGLATDHASTTSHIDNQNQSTTSHAIKQFIGAYLQESKTDRLSLSSIARDMVPYIMSPIDYEERIRAGYEAADVIIRCVYNGYECSYRNFTTVMNPDHGNCYVFNSDGRYGVSRKHGADAGLSVTYAVRTREYLSFIESTGIRAIISERDKPIFPDTQGFDVLTGFRTSVSLRPTAIRALSTRRKPCLVKADNLHPYYYEERKYSTEACLRSCYQRRVIEMCQCGDPRIPLPDNVTHCPLSNRQCVNENYEVLGGEHCTCPSECRIDQSDISITMSRCSSNHTSHLSTRIPVDVLDITVYLASPFVIVYRERIDYTLDMFCWDLANVIATFMGASAISVIAVIQGICRSEKKIRNADTSVRSASQAAGCQDGRVPIESL